MAKASPVTPAERIALSALRAVRTDDGIIAGTHHFVDLWARDSLFASLGADAWGQTALSKTTIESFLKHQRDDGLIPFLIRRSKLTVGKYFGRQEYYKEPRAQFRSSQSGGLVPDGGLLTVIAARDYIETAADKKTAVRWYPYLAAALRWYTRRFGGGLIREWFQCEWADAVLKTGMTLYTNVVYWKALGDMLWIAERVGSSEDARAWKEQQTKIGRMINAALWTGTYFADWKNVFRHDYFSSHANMLAVIFGLADRTQSASILEFAKRYCWNGWTLETNAPKYPFWRISALNYLTGTGDYHNRGCLWLQPGVLYAVALWKTGRRKEAKAVMSAVSVKICEYDGVFEVYEKTGSPVQRLLYRSEGPFAWSAGLFLWARSIIGK